MARVVTATHKTKNELNNSDVQGLVAKNHPQFSCFARHTSVQLNKIPVPAELREQVMKRLREHNPDADGKSARLSHLNLVIGSRWRLTDGNQFRHLGLFNGAVGTLVGIEFEGGVPLSFEANRAEAPRVSSRRMVVMLQMDNYTGPSVDGYPRGVIPLAMTPMKKTPKVTCPLFKGSSDVISAYRFHFPMAPAPCITIHTCQGITAHHGLIVSPACGTGNFEFALNYVGISRVGFLHKLYLLQFLSSVVDIFSIFAAVARQRRRRRKRAASAVAPLNR
mmetsp:Transcript_11088/g.36482  ORF Transcript_11088/g.36482 Transcript_11088/m.36482 type:complete len:278 (-) Transcript_11088:508-1341(-)